MNRSAILYAGVLAASSMIPGIASASFVLDTGAPTGTGAPFVLSNSQFAAAEFSLSATENIGSVAAYMTQGAGQPGDKYVLDIFSGSGFLGARNAPTPLDTVTGVFTANGWNSTNVSWNLGSGTYWLALQVSSTTQTKGLDLPVESSTTTGTAPALGFAYLGTGTNSQYTQAGALPIGVQITASPVPLPAAFWLLGSGLLGCAGLARRRVNPGAR